MINGNLVAWALLLMPVSLLGIYLSLAAFARGIYELTSVVEKIPARAGSDHAGIWRVLLRWSRMQRLLWRPGSRLHCLRRLAMSCYFVCAAAAGGSLVALFCLIPLGVARNLIGQSQPAGAGVPAALCLGAVLGVSSLARALGYVTHPDRSRSVSEMPKLALSSAQVEWPRRVGVARSVYFYRQLHTAGKMAFGLAAGLVLLGLTDPATTLTAGPSSATSTPAQNLYSFLVLASAAASWGLQWSLEKVVDVLQPLPRAVLALEAARGTVSSAASTRSYGGIQDPLGGQRESLAKAGDCLLRAARRVDSGSALHPVATILRGCAFYLRQHLASADSLATDVPSAVHDVLQAAEVLIAGPRQVSFYSQLARTVSAFDSNGNPNSILRASPPGRWAVLGVRAAGFIEAYSRALYAAWTVFILAVAAYFILTHQLDLRKLQLQL